MAQYRLKGKTSFVKASKGQFKKYHRNQLVPFTDKEFAALPESEKENFIVIEPEKPKGTRKDLKIQPAKPKAKK